MPFSYLLRFALSSDRSKFTCKNFLNAVMLWGLLCLSAFSHAQQVFTVPTTSSNGSIPISWSGGRSYVEIQEKFGSGAWSTVWGGSASGSTTLTGRVNGTYTYQLRDCLVTGGQGGSSTSCQIWTPAKTVTVNITSGAVVNPVFSPAAGSYVGNINVSISTSTTDATIRYTTDNTSVTGSSPVYSSAIALSASATVRAKAFKSGMTDSAETSASYTLNVAAPSISPGSGNYTGSVNVSLTSSTGGATIRYTTDNTAVTSASPVYSGAITLSNSTVVRAKAFKSGMSDSAESTASFSLKNFTASVVNGQVAFGWTGGRTYVEIQEQIGSGSWTTVNGGSGASGSVAMDRPNGTYNYQLKDCLVTGGQGGTSTSCDIWPITRTVTVNNTPVSTPTISPNGGTSVGSVSVSLATATSGATIRYTTDNSAVTTSSPVYSSALTFTANTTLRVKAFKSGMGDSAEASAAFYVAVATPGISPNGGSNVGSISVALSTSTSGATIRYTIDGSAVTASSPIYSSPLTITANTTLRTKAFKAGMTDSGEASASFIVAAYAPSISPNGGSHTGSVSVTLSTATSGATIRYTTDNTAVTTSSPIYSSAFTLTSSATVRAKTFKSGVADSTESSAAFTVVPAVVATPSINPNGGTYSDSVTVSIGSSTSGATIRYTTDNSAVTASSPVYSSAFALTGNATIRAKAFKSGMTDSGEASASFTVTPSKVFNVSVVNGQVAINWTGARTYAEIEEQVGSSGSWAVVNGGNGASAAVTMDRANGTYTYRLKDCYVTGGQGGTSTSCDYWAQTRTVVVNNAVIDTPVFTPNGGNAIGSVSVSITTATSGATIRYTTDNTAVIATSPAYSSALTLSANTTLRAKAFKAGMSDSAEASAAFYVAVATPTISPNGGSYIGAANVTLATATSGATIRYTTNNTAVTSSSPVYSSALSLTSNTTLRVKAFKAGMNDSAENSASFTVEPAIAATPTISPNGGTHNDSVSVSLSTTTTSGTIRYTTDNTAVTSSSPVYSAPLTLTQNTTVRAKTFKAGVTESAEASASFTVKRFDVALNSSGQVVMSWSGARTYAEIYEQVNGGAWSSGAVTGGNGATATPEPLDRPNGTYSYRLRDCYVTGGQGGTTTSCDNWDQQIRTVVVSNPVVATPVITPNGGTITASTSISISTATSGATIRYTTDNTAVTKTSPLYSAALTLPASATLRTKAFKVGMSDSAETSASFTVETIAATPVISPNGGTHNDSVTVSLSTTTSGGTIRYTTDNTAVTASSPVYSAPFAVTQNTTVRAKTFKSGVTESPEATASFTVKKFSAALNGSGQVAISWSGARTYAEIYEQLNGGAWSASAVTGGNGATATPEPLDRPNGTYSYRLKDCYVTGGQGGTSTSCENWDQQIRTVVVNNPVIATPVIAPNGGTITASTSISITTATSGATIRYTTDNTPVTKTSPVYSSALTLPASATLRTKAFKVGMSDSAETSASFTVETIAVTPTISPNGGTHNDSVSVSLSTTTSGGTIRYTTDGTAVTASSPVYTGAFTLTQNATVRAKTFKSGVTESPEASASFTVKKFNVVINSSGQVEITWSGARTYVEIEEQIGTGAWSIVRGGDGDGGVMPVDRSNGTYNYRLKDCYVTGGQGGSSTSCDYWTQIRTVVVNNPVVATPSITPNGGNSIGSVSVSLATATSGATIRYTTNNTAVTPGSPIYSSALTFTADTILRTKAFKAGMSESAEVSATFNVAAATPQFNPAPGTYLDGVTVGISTATSGALIRYTLDNTPVVATSPLYSSTVMLFANATIRAKAYKAGMTESAEQAGAYVVESSVVATPTISPNGGAHNDSVAVSLSTATTGATIRYTIDNTAVTASSPVYSAPFTLTSNATVRAKAFKANRTDSTERSAVFTIKSFKAELVNGKVAISWSGARTYVEIEEKIGTGSWGSAVGGGNGASGGFTLDRANGIYTYRLKDCYVTGSQSGTSTSCDYWTILPSVTIANPVVTAFYEAESASLLSGVVIQSINTGYSGTGYGDYNATAGSFIEWTISREQAGNTNLLVKYANGNSTSRPMDLYINNQKVGSAQFATTGTWTTWKEEPFSVSLNAGVNKIKLVATSAGPDVDYIELREAQLTDVAAPVFNPGTGNYSQSVTVAISSPTSGATIRYTTNNSPVTASSTVYVSPFPLTTSKVVRARAFKAGMADSIETNAEYTIVTGTVFEAELVEGMVEIRWSGARTYVELEEKTATTNWKTVEGGNGGNGVRTLPRDAGTYLYRIKDCLVTGGQGGTTTDCSYWPMERTVVVTQSAVIKPVISPDGGEHGGPVAVRITTATPGAVIRYTTNDTAVSGSSKVYLGEFTLFKDTIIRAKAFKNGMTASLETNAEFTLTSDVIPESPLIWDGQVNDPPPMEEPTNQTIGSLGGQFRVNEAGAATYNIDIATATGVAGVEPEISVGYNSQAGNGLLGKGWTLGGLGEISRCRQTVSQDGVAKPVTWSSDDRFCLNGQRLILVGSGTYGATGTTYRTEIDSFVTVTAVGGTTGHPDYFEVEAKDGSTTRYGAAGDSESEIAALGTNGAVISDRVLTWNVSLFEDSVGNAINFTYERSANYHRIEEITYASGQAKLSFEYEDRIDELHGYIAGYKFSNTQRLKKIYSYNGSDLLRSYELEYEVQYNVSRIKEIKECVTGACYPATKFTWHKPDGSGVWLGGFSQPSANYDVSNYTFLDINGNGVMDYVWSAALNNTSTTTLFYSLDSGVDTSNTDTSAAFGYLTNTKTPKLIPFDYNADSRQDLLVYDHSIKKWRLYIAQPTATGWELSYLHKEMPFTDKYIRVGDIDSDGLADVIETTSGGTALKVFKLVKDPAATSPGSNLTYQFDSGTQLNILGAGGGDPGISFKQYNEDDNPKYELADFNGDGLVDIAAIDTAVMVEGALPDGESPALKIFTKSASDATTYNLVVDKPVPQQSPPPETPSVNNIIKMAVVDINSDGNTDIAVKFDLINVWFYSINDGTNFSDFIPMPGRNNGNISIDDISFVDINRDGHTDVVWREEEGFSKPVFGISWNPKTNSFGSSFYVDQYVNSNWSYMYLDANGDTWMDRVSFGKNAGAMQLRIYSRASDAVEHIPNGSNVPMVKPDVIEKITDGLGNETKILTETMSRSAHYLPVGDFKTYANTYIQCDEGGIESYDPITGDANYRDPECNEVTGQAVNADDFYTNMNNPFDYSSAYASDLPDQESNSFSVNAPVLEIVGSLPIVASVESTAPVAGKPAATSLVEYRYKRARMQAKGRGMLGFGYVASIDAQSGIKTETLYRQDWPFIGSPMATTTYTSSGAVLKEAVSVWGLSDAANSSVFQPYIKTSIERTYGLNSDNTVSTYPLQTVSTETVMETGGNGNVDTLSITTQGGGKTLVSFTDNQYSSDAWEKRMGRLLNTTVTTTLDQQTPIVKNARFTYYPSGVQKGLLHQEYMQEGTDDQIVKEHIYDSWGNTHQVKTTGKTNATTTETRTTTTNYDESGRYVTSSSNDAGQSITYSDRNKYGQHTQTTDINDLTTEVKYDKFGKEYLRYEKRSDGTTGAWTRIDSDWCNGDCPESGRFYKRTRVSGGGEAIEYFDSLGRVIRSAKVAFDGRWIYVDSDYDSLGRNKHQSLPYFNDESPAGVVSNDYDSVGRLTRVVAPGDNDVNVITSSSYTATASGIETTLVNPAGNQRKEVRNVLGQLIQVNDQLQGTLTYEYSPTGALYRVVTSAPDASDVVVRMCYDSLGRKIGMHDPDKGGFKGSASTSCTTVQGWSSGSGSAVTGWWHYKYNAFGELIEQRDPKGQRSVMTYDKLGRMVTRKDYLPSSVLEANTAWFYDAPLGGGVTAKTQGKLTAVITNSSAAAIADSMSSCSGSNYCQTFNYSARSQVDGTSTHLPDGQEFFTETKYDTIGRAYQKNDALDDFGGVLGFESGVQTHFNEYGYAYRTVDIAPWDQTNGVLSETEEVNASGQVTREKRGNGLTSVTAYYPASGLLKSQQTLDAIGLNYIQSNDYTWDDLGNLSSRVNKGMTVLQNGSSVQTRNREEGFCYDVLNRLVKTSATKNPVCGNAANDVTYDGLGNIKSKANMNGGAAYEYDRTNGGPHAVTKIGNTSYQYDANGNMTSETGSGSVLGDRNFEYTSYDMVKRIARGGSSVEFKYGPDRTRWQRIDTKTNGPTVTTTYLGNVERIETSGLNEIEWKRNVSGVLLTYRTSKTPAANESHLTLLDANKSYLYSDHLGSIELVTNVEGTATHSMSFDPWGLRREGDLNDVNAWGQSANKTNLQVLNEIVASLNLTGFSRPITTRGFTGHEMLDEMGVIHMNGRIYDAKLGRFLQADPFIQTATNTQSYNRYSYLLNNPLNATDPSGFFLKKLWNKIRPFVAAIVAAVLTYYCGGNPACGEFAYLWIGGISGAAGAAANGGNILQGAITGMVTAAVFNGIGNSFGGTAVKDGGSFWSWTSQGGAGHIFAHAMAGGILSTLQGGKFGHGFVSAGLSKGFDSNFDMESGTAGAFFGETIINAVVGGTISQITGGKFANGAITSAFQHLFNELGHRDITPEEAQPIMDSALEWKGTPYADQEVLAGGETYPYHGGNALVGVGADCSGSTQAIFGEAGFEYKYTQSSNWATNVSKGTIPFRALSVTEALQIGDVLHFGNHVAIYAGNGEMWTARNSSVDKVTGEYKNKPYTKMKVDFWNRKVQTRYRYQVKDSQ